MAEVFGVQITGKEEAILSLKLMDKEVRDTVKEGLERGAGLIVARAKEIITTVQWEDATGRSRIGHIKTGNLRRSIDSRAEVGIGGHEIVVNVGTDVHYAPFIESLPDGGFLLPAFIQKQPEALREMQKVIVELLDRKDTA